MKPAKTILLSLLLVGSLQAQCNVLGMDKKELSKKYNLFEYYNKELKRSIYFLDGLEFEIPDLDKIYLNFNDMGRIEYLELDFKTSQYRYEIIKFSLDAEYILMSYTRDENSFHSRYKIKNEDCYINLSYSPENFLKTRYSSQYIDEGKYEIDVFLRAFYYLEAMEQILNSKKEKK